MQMDAVTGDALTDAGQQVDAVRVVLPQGKAMDGQRCVMADDVGGPGARDGQHAESVSLGRCGRTPDAGFDIGAPPNPNGATAPDGTTQFCVSHAEANGLGGGEDAVLTARERLKSLVHGTRLSGIRSRCHPPVALLWTTNRAPPDVWTTATHRVVGNSRRLQ